MNSKLPTLGEVLHPVFGNDVVRYKGGKTTTFDKCSNNGTTKKKPMKKRKK